MAFKRSGVRLPVAPIKSRGWKGASGLFSLDNILDNIPVLRLTSVDPDNLFPLIPGGELRDYVYNLPLCLETGMQVLISRHS